MSPVGPTSLRAAATAAVIAAEPRGERLGQQRALGLDQGAGLGVDLAHKRTDDEAIVRKPDVVEHVTAVDRHDHLGSSQPEVHERNQALAASEDLCVVAVLGQRSPHLVERLGSDKR